MTLAEEVGRPAAHRILEEATRRALQEQVELTKVLRDDPQVLKCLPAEKLQSTLDPANYLGSSDVYIDRVLARAARAPNVEDDNALR